MIECKRLSLCFPAIKREFMLILAERIKSNKMTAMRLHDAIDDVIDNFTYQTPTVANIIQFDRKAKVFTYHEAADMAIKANAYMSEMFSRVTINGELRWMLK